MLEISPALRFHKRIQISSSNPASEGFKMVDLFWVQGLLGVTAFSASIDYRSNTLLSIGQTVGRLEDIT